MSCACGGDAVYFSEGVYCCHPCHIGVYNVQERRWVRTEEEIFDTVSFIDYAMPLWRGVPRNVQLTVVRNTGDNNTERWVGLQLSELSMRNGLRVFPKKELYHMRNGFSIVITAHYEGRPPKLLAFTKFAINSGEADIDWYISGQVEVDGKRTGLGTLLIITSVYLARKMGATSVHLQAINEQVANIYANYGFEMRSASDPDEMIIRNIDQVIERYDYVGKIREFTRLLESMLETDDQQRQFYNSIRGSYDRLLPTSLKSEMIWQCASVIVDGLIGGAHTKPELVQASDIHWRNMQMMYNNVLVRDSPFSNATRAFYLGFGVIKFEKVREHLQRIAAIIGLEASFANTKTERASTVIVLPSLYTDKSFLPALLLLHFVRQLKPYSRVRFLSLGDVDNFLENFTAKRRVNYYYPLDICVSDLESLERVIEQIENVAFDVKGSGAHGFDIFCTAAYVTKKARKLCHERNVLLFDPILVRTVGDTMKDFNLRAKTEKNLEDDRILMVSDYIDYRKLPIFAIDYGMIASMRGIPVTRKTYATLIHNPDVETNSNMKYISGKLPYLDLADLVVEAMTFGNSTFPTVKVATKTQQGQTILDPMMTGKTTHNVFAYMATIDPASIRINPTSEQY